MAGWADGWMGGVEHEDHLKGYCRYSSSIMLCNRCWSIKIEESCLSFRTHSVGFNVLEAIREWYMVGAFCGLNLYWLLGYWCC